MANPIKVGLVGLGRAGWGTHLKNFEATNGLYKVVAACDIEKERTESAVKRLDCKGYDSIEELVKDPEVELVDIATRSCDHFKHAMIALKAGKAVVLEKPVATKFEEVLELFEYAARKDTPALYIRQNRRNEAVFQKVKSVIESGVLGTISEINIEQRGYERRDDWQTIDEFGGGLLLNWGPHIVDHAVILLDSEIKAQFGALQHSTAGGDREDTISLHLLGENGRKVNMWITGSSALRGGRRFTVFGNRGAIETTDRHVHIRYIDPNQKLPEVKSNPGNPAMEWGKSGTFETKVPPEWIEETYDFPSDKMMDMWYDLYESFRNGKEYFIKPEEIIRMMKVLCKLREENVFDLTAHRDEL